ncbi:MAG: DNA polymerase III subunit chi [Herbaspirillum frisingense]|uniref:DNA polymerase III subunit chi n=1 Tax=Herbaspirillum frisingense TaxID=92645 RepID=A0A7V8FYP7_9BURK|nr:MAG: DNA polymerase III subunit chi [Herbaspirillum frisingense]
MTRIDFHSNVPQKIAYVCRLVRKARASGANIVLRARDRAELQQLDQALWSFSEQDFLPHVMAGDPLAAQTPIILAASDDVELPHHQILINLSGETPVHFARFERMLEIISADDADKAAGRERYRFYKERGYPLSHHVAA